MPKTKVAITLDAGLLKELDGLVAQARYPNRRQAIEAALVEKLARVRRVRLAQECAKLDPREEKAIAEEGSGAARATWQQY